MQALINVAQKWITFTKLNYGDSQEYIPISIKVILDKNSNSVYFGYNNLNFDVLIRFDYYHAIINDVSEIQTDVTVKCKLSQISNDLFITELAQRYSKILETLEAIKDKPLSFEPVGDYKEHLADATAKLRAAYNLQVIEKAKVELEQIHLSEQKVKEIAIEKRTPKKTKKVEIKNLF